jgi:hypothetical protein
VPGLLAHLQLRRRALLLIDDRDQDDGEGAGDDDGDDDEARTSAEWADLFDIEIVRPDGWDAADFEEDFYVKRISREEFLDRAERSITRPLRGP